MPRRTAATRHAAARLKPSTEQIRPQPATNAFAPHAAQKYKLCRRVLKNPVVEVDTYCRALKDGKPHGEGELNAAGEREGAGVRVYASGNMYEGQWRAGLIEGVGTEHGATGNTYVGQFVAGKKEGEGTYHYADGRVDVGRYKSGAGEGARWSAGRATAWRLTNRSGKPVEAISLEEAARIAERVGLPVPGASA